MQKLSGMFLLTVLLSGSFSSSFAFAQVGPVAEDDFYSVNEDSLLTVQPLGVLLNDTNTNSNTFTSILQANVVFGNLTLNSDGSFSYQPDPNFDSIDSFTYAANNGTHNSNNATVTISVTPVNDTPISEDDLAETKQNIPVLIDVLGNDSDIEGDSLSILLQIDPSTTNGTAVIQDDKVLFTPNFDFLGDTSFSYMVSDGQNTSDSATVNVTVTPSDGTVLDRILNQIQSIFAKILNLESEVTQLREENSALAMRIMELESIVGNDDNDDDSNEKITVCHKDKRTISISENAVSAHLNHGDELGACIDNNDDKDDEITDKKAIEGKIKALKNDFKAQEKELKNDFKAQEKELKKQLKELKKDKKSSEDDDED